MFPNDGRQCRRPRFETEPPHRSTAGLPARPCVCIFFLPNREFHGGLRTSLGRGAAADQTARRYLSRAAKPIVLISVQSAAQINVLARRPQEFRRILSLRPWRPKSPFRLAGSSLRGCRSPASRSINHPPDFFPQERVAQCRERRLLQVVAAHIDQRNRAE
jgi:hypothetical protein